MSSLNRINYYSVLGLLFVLAPIGNLLISFAGSGVENWWEPDFVLYFLKSVPWWDYLWLSLIAVSGFFLISKHKIAGILSIFSLIIVLVVNLTRLIQKDPNSIEYAYLNIFSGFSIVAVLILAWVIYSKIIVSRS